MIPLSLVPLMGGAPTNTFVSVRYDQSHPDVCMRVIFILPLYDYKIKLEDKSSGY